MSKKAGKAAGDHSEADRCQPSADHLTALALPGGKRAAKTFGPDFAQGYPNGLRWAYAGVPYEGFDDFAAALTELQDLISYIVIRGEPVPDLDTSGLVLRRKDARPSAPATFVEADPGRRWIMIDIDNAFNPRGKPRDEAEMRALTYAIYTDVMPEAFHDVWYWYQWSNSMGTGATADWSMVKIHFWLLLEQPFRDRVLEQWAETIDGVDACVFRTVQPNYIASPGFLGGMVDPLGAWRSGAVKEFGERERAPLVYEYVEPVTLKVRDAAVVRLQQALWAKERAHFRHIDIDRASPPMAKVAEIGVRGRLHNPIIASAASWITCCGLNPDYQQWAELVRGQVAVSGHPQASHRASEAYLRQTWTSAQRKYRPLNPTHPPVPRELLINTNKF